MANIFDFLSKYLGSKPSTVTQTQIQAATTNTQQFDMLKKFGIVQGDLAKALEAADLIQFERDSLYQAINKSLAHPLMSAASSLYADVSTTYNRTNNATVWGMGKNKEYQYQLDKFLNIINIEEVIYDWAWTISTFGDLFIDIHGEPGVGIVSINDVLITMVD
jgi:hypothetical protein